MANGVVVRILGDDSDLKKTLGDSAKNVAKWGAATAAAAAVASVAITKSTADSAREIKNLSKLIGASATDFQKMAAGAKTVGIEQEKLADIFKDVNDKVGDFMQTGAGPLVDFFENIAPKVGVTADQFKNLSGPQAMQKYVNALEAANVSQSEMTFYMEAIASDAALLTPLLSKNGEGFKKIGDQAEKAGAILSDIDIAKLNQLDQAVISGEQSIKGMANKIAVKLAPQLEGVTKLIDDFTKSAGGIDSALDSAFKGSLAAIGFFGDTIRGIEILVQGIEVAFRGLSVGVNTFVTLLVEKIDYGVQYSMATINNLIDQVNKVPGVNIEKMVVGKSMIAESMRAGLEDAKTNLSTAVDKMQKKLLEPLPSTAIKEFVAANEAASNELAEEAIKANEAKNESNIVQIDTELMAASEKFNKLLEIEQAYQEASKEGLESFNANNLRTAEEYAAATEKLEQASAQRKRDIASQMMGNLSSLMQTENKKLFNIGKVAAISEALITGYSSVLKAYDGGLRVSGGNPVVGAAFATTAGIATAVQISKISSASYGGGGSTAGGMGGAAPNVPQQQAQQPQQQDQSRTVRFETVDPSALVSGSMINKIADQLVELQNDGYKLVV